jgi:hypothetical protein
LEKTLKPIVAILAFLALVGIFFWTQQYTSRPDIVLDSPDLEVPTSSSISPENPPPREPTAEEDTDPFHPSKFPPEEQLKIEQLRVWNEKRGAFSYYRDYGHLSDQDLEALGSTGDIGALQMLAERHNISSPEESIAHLEQAAIYGSTFALVQAGDLHYFHTKRGSNLVDADNPDAGPTMSLAYYLAAQIAGDDFNTAASTPQLLSEYEFSDEMTSEACREAKSIASRLEQRRIALGLNEYDRTPAPRGLGVPPDSKVAALCKSNQ